MDCNLKKLGIKSILSGHGLFSLNEIKLSKIKLIKN